MAFGLTLGVLFATCIAAISADVQVLTDNVVRNRYTDVNAVVVDGYYMMVYVGEESQGDFNYSIGLFELVNGTELVEYKPSRASPLFIKSENKYLRLTADTDRLSVTSTSIAKLVVCSSSVCTEFFVSKENVIYDTRNSWCHTGILSTDHLRSVTRSGDSTAAIVSRGMDIYAYLCLPGNRKASIKLKCADNSVAFTEIHSVEASIKSDNLNVFILLSNAQETVLCSFTQSLDINDLSGFTSDTISTITQSSRLVFDYSPVALAVSHARADYIAFVSSSTGKVSKVYIQSTGAYKINEFIIDPAIDNIFTEMLLEDDKLLLTTTERMLLLDVEQTCEQHKDLCSCRAPKDPKCGWCVDSNTCTKKPECELIWIKADPSSSTVCWNATATPTSVARTNPEPLRISVSEDMGNDKFAGRITAYSCIFGANNRSTAVSSSEDQSITCSPPEQSMLAGLPEGSLELPVVIYYKPDEDYLPLLVQYKMVICSAITSCGECVNSHNSCVWCINDHKCADTSSVAAECPDSDSAEARSMFGSNETCPAITESSVRAPVNEDFELAFPVRNFPTLLHLRYSCLVTDSANQTTIRRATKTGDRIVCDQLQYGSSTNSQAFLLNSFSVKVVVGDNNWELAEAKGRVYDCSYQTACTQCVQDSSTSNCGWCHATTQCLYRSCPNSELPISTREKCPFLNIFEEEVSPRVVPIEGELTLSIPGKGLNVGDGVKTAEISVGDQPCRNITVSAEELNDGQTIKTIDVLHCMIPSVLSRRRASLNITLNGLSWQQPSFITYFDPNILKMNVRGSSDNYGPVAGGTEILISGTDLDSLGDTIKSVEFVNDDFQVALVNCRVQDGAILCETPRVRNDSELKYNVLLKFTEKFYERPMAVSDSSTKFEYRQDSIIKEFKPKSVIRWGGKNFTVKGQFLNSVSRPRATFGSSSAVTGCRVMNPEEMTCRYPEFNTVGETEIILLMDGIEASLTTLNLTVKANPTFKNFSSGTIEKSEQGLFLDGTNIGNVEGDEIAVFVGGVPCNITKKESSTVICTPPQLPKEQQEKNTEVTINIYGVRRFKLGSLNYAASATAEGLSDAVIGGIAGGGSAAVIIMVIVAVLLFRRSRYHKQRYKTMVKQVEQLECNSRHEIKQAFAELQTDMSDLMSDLTATGIPYWDYKNFTFKILFPGQTDHPSLHKLMTKRKTAVMQALDKFEHLIYNKHFLVSFIHTLENQPTFTMADRVQIASLLMLTLQHKMDYATVVIKELLSELIDSSIKKKHPKLLLRRSDSVVEKMLTHWLSLCLYKYLQDHAGTPLFMLFKAIKHQIDKGPVDALSGEARYSLSQERLLRLTVNTKPILLEVLLENGDRIQCKANDCDTTSQVKEKILDVIYKNQAFSQRPMAADFNLEWHPGMVGVPICDEDLTSQTINGWKRLNTLSHYGVSDSAIMKLASKHHAHSLHSDRSRDTDKLCDTLTSNRGTPRGTLTRNGALSTSNLQDHYVPSHITLWHLSKSGASQTLPKDRQQTMMSEIFLTRLLKTKGTLQEFIDKLFQTIFSADNLPPTIKFLFDFLDQEAQRHGITDPEVVHVWKNNSLNLRFWVNIIKNPEFVFDIHKSEIVDASLSTIAQTFIDSCAMTESDFGVDAPINKLLFARDRPKYRKLLQNMYSEIRSKPTVPEQTLNAHLNELSKTYPKEFYRNSALKEIYQFAQRYQSQIIQDLEDNFPKHRNPNLTTLLKDINTTLDERHTHLTDYV